ncbi:MAG: hypothetical protein ACYSWP_21990 [Planctomycetota bacterium]
MQLERGRPLALEMAGVRFLVALDRNYTPTFDTCTKALCCRAVVQNERWIDTSALIAFICGRIHPLACLLMDAGSTLPTAMRH